MEQEAPVFRNHAPAEPDISPTCLPATGDGELMDVSPQITHSVQRGSRAMRNHSRIGIV
jgi:hypothetical protein